MLNDVDAGAKPRFPIVAAISVLVVLAALITLLLAGYGYRSEWWHFSTGVKLAEWSAYAAAGGAFLALLALVFGRGDAGRAGTVLPVLTLLIAAPMLLLAAQWEYAARTTPPITDISTDTEDPPFFWDVPNPMDYPGEEAAALQHEFYPDIAPLETSATPEAAYAAALELVKARGWELVADVPDEGRIEAIARSRLFGFPDEVILRVGEGDDGALIDMRSRSRLGRVDRGVNAKRIREFLADLEQALTGA